MSEYRMIAEYWGCRENAPAELIEEFNTDMDTMSIAEAPMEATEETFAIMPPSVNAPTRDAMLEMWR